MKKSPFVSTKFIKTFLRLDSRIRLSTVFFVDFALTENEGGIVATKEAVMLDLLTDAAEINR